VLRPSPLLKEQNLRIPLSFEETLRAALDTPPERKPKKKVKARVPKK
jgi:hypothetical protein